MKKYMRLIITAVMILIMTIPCAGTMRVLAQENDTGKEVHTGEAAGGGSEQDPVTGDALSDSVTGDPAESTDVENGTTDSGETEPAGGDGGQPDTDPDEEPDDDDIEYAEWQTEEDEYDTETTNTVTFIITGTDSVHAAINSDFNTAEDDIDYSEEIRNGDSKDLLHGSTVRIQGIPGSYIRAAYGETEEEARDNPDPEISGPGQSVSIGQDGDGYIYIRVSENREDVVDENTNTATVADDEEGTIIYSDISNDDADAGRTQATFPKAGQKFTGTAKLTSYTLKTHNSIGYLVPTNGWLKENTTQKNIAAVCISGPTKAMANKGAKFNYIVKILEADPTTGKIRVGITFKPRSNKNNVSWGTVNNFHAGTQVLYKTMNISLHPLTGYVTLKKIQAAKNNNYAASFPNNYTLAGARYRLYSDAACTSPAADEEGSSIEFVTSADGSTDIREVEPGTYYAKEISASRGFRTDKTVRSVEVTTDNDYSNPAVITSAEEPLYTGTELRLIKENEDFGYKRLLGTKYELSYYDTDPDHPVLNSSTLKRTWTYAARYLETSDGLKGAGIDFAADDPVSGTPYTEDGSRIVPLGVITIKEVEAPKGLAVDKKVYMGSVRQNGETAKLSINGQSSMTVRYDTEMVHDEESKAVILKILKVDSETGRPEAEGSEREYSKGSLAGAVYEVYREDTDLAEDVKVGTITTDENGCGEISRDQKGDALKPGRYYIRETKASPGYVRDHLYEKDAKNKYEDGRHIVLARADLDNNISVYEYQTVSHEVHHETLISKTDITTGEELPGATLQVINSDGNIVEEWISSDKPHLIKALPDGKYTLREITAPYGYDIAEDAEFEVVKDVISCEVTMADKPVTIGTTATDSQTESHAGIIAGEEVITDAVKLTGLYPGRQYRITGSMIDRDSGKPVYHKEISETGETVYVASTAEKEFTADAEEMSVTLEFTVDSSLFTKETTTVAFEKLYRTSAVYETEEVPVELQKHENPDDEEQTIHYGGIAGTIATDHESGTHNVLAGKDAVITDLVMFSNLSVKAEYRLLGELFDKTTGQMLGIEAETEFVPEFADGTAEMEFRLDARGLEDHEIVVFETLYIGDTVIDEHKEPDNEAQTCRIVPEPEKSAGPKTGDDNMMPVYIMMLSLSAALLAILILKNRRKV